MSSALLGLFEHSICAFLKTNPFWPQSFPFIYSKTVLFIPGFRDRLLTPRCSVAGPSWVLSCHGSVIIMITMLSHTRSPTGIRNPYPQSAASTSRSVTSWSSIFMMPCTKIVDAESPYAGRCSWMKSNQVKDNKTINCKWEYFVRVFAEFRWLNKEDINLEKNNSKQTTKNLVICQTPREECRQIYHSLRARLRSYQSLERCPVFLAIDISFAIWNL